VSFEEAQTVFFDEHGLLLEDPDPDDPQERFVLIGLSSALRLLLVCHCLREGGELIQNHQRPASEQARGEAVLGKAETMKKEYDFSRARKNPYAKRLKKQITIRLDEPTIAYFKGVAELSGIPYQTLINLYLRDCAQKGRKLSMDWRASA